MRDIREIVKGHLEVTTDLTVHQMERALDSLVPFIEQRIKEAEKGVCDEGDSDRVSDAA